MSSRGLDWGAINSDRTPIDPGYTDIKPVDSVIDSGPAAIHPDSVAIDFV